MKKIVSFVLFVSALFLSASVSSDVISSRVEAAVVTQVNAAHILVPTEAQAIKIREEIMQGQTSGAIFANFMNAARKYSTCPSGKSGGILGYFSRGDMVKPFEEAAFATSIGQVTEPVKTQFGWHLIYVIAKK